MPLSSALHALRRPFQYAALSVELVQSALRLRATVQALAVPLATPHLPFHEAITAERSVALRDLPLDRVKAIAHASGTHVNDVVLAVLAGTLRQWLLDRGQLPDRNLADPRERLVVTAAVANSGNAIHAAVGGSTLEHLTSVAYPLILSVPSNLYQRSRVAARHPAPVNVVVSNVAGPPHRALPRRASSRGVLRARSHLRRRLAEHHRHLLPQRPRLRVCRLPRSCRRPGGARRRPGSGTRGARSGLRRVSCIAARRSAPPSAGERRRFGHGEDVCG
jgi:hypothetical protein